MQLDRHPGPVRKDRFCLRHVRSHHHDTHAWPRVIPSEPPGGRHAAQVPVASASNTTRPVIVVTVKVMNGPGQRRGDANDSAGCEPTLSAQASPSSLRPDATTTTQPTMSPECDRGPETGPSPSHWAGSGRGGLCVTATRTRIRDYVCLLLPCLYMLISPDRLGVHGAWHERVHRPADVVVVTIDKCAEGGLPSRLHGPGTTATATTSTIFDAASRRLSDSGNIGWHE